MRTLSSSASGAVVRIAPLSARVVSEIEDIFHGCLPESLPRCHLLIEKPLRVAKLDGEDVQHYSADRRHPSGRERHRPRLWVLDEPVVPAMVLRRCKLEERLVPQRTAIAGAHTRK